MQIEGTIIMSVQQENQKLIDKQNKEFWNEKCGTTLAKILGIPDTSAESLAIFDDKYIDLYPYLLPHIKPERMKDGKVLEIGLGWGTVSQKIMEAGAKFFGLDIAENPVEMSKHRMKLLSVQGTAIQGSYLENDFESDFFDFVVSIGCFHHTGNIKKCIDETYRILKPGGIAIIMLYNQFSLRQWVKWPKKTFLQLFSSQNVSQEQKAAYDANSEGKNAPETQFSSIRGLKRTFKNFSKVRFFKENSDDMILFGKFFIPRKKLLKIVGPLMGLDIYIEAQK